MLREAASYLQVGTERMNALIDPLRVCMWREAKEESRRGTFIRCSIGGESCESLIRSNSV